MKDKKISALRTDFFNTFKIVYQDNWFVNLTDTEIPTEYKWILSLGKKFAVPIEHRTFPLFKLIADVEQCIKLIDDPNQQEVTRAKITNVVTNRLNGGDKHNALEKAIVKIHSDCVQFLKKNRHLIIVQADKGGATVAMLKSEYDDKMDAIFNNPTNYIELNKNPLNKLELRSNKLVNELFRIGEIDEQTKKRMITHNTQIPRVYGLPKVHKDPPISLRHIVSTPGSPMSQLAIHLDRILKKILHDGYDAPNSFAVKEKLKNIRISRNEILASLDIIQLFPSIPIELVLKLIEDQWEEIAKHTKMDKALFMDITKFVLLDAAVLTHNDKIYQQINGISMGSNLAPTIANLVTNAIFDYVVPKLPFKPKILSKYVDDILMIIPKRFKPKVLELFNSFMPGIIKFTIEEESDDKIPFLDLLIMRQVDGSIKTTWYQKPTASGRILNYYSQHSIRQKSNVIFNTLLRAMSLSDDEYKNESIERAKNLLIKSNYPMFLIKKQLQRVKNKIENNNTPHTQSNTTQEDEIARRGFLFIPKTSDQLKKILKNQINNIDLAYRPVTKIANTIFSNTKQKTTTNDKTGVVYSIPCDGNDEQRCDKEYIGQTKNQFYKRKSQHLLSFKNKDYEQASGLVLHAHETGHSFNFEKAKIIDVERNLSKRLTLESLHIAANNTCNIQREKGNASAVYSALVHKHSNARRISNLTADNSNTQ